MTSLKSDEKDEKDDEKKLMEIDDDEGDDEEETEKQDILLKSAELSSTITLLRKNNEFKKSENLLSELMKIYDENNMIEFYRDLCSIKTNKISLDESLITKWQKNKEKLLMENDKKKELATKNEGDFEIHEVELERAEILSKTSDLKTSINSYLEIKNLTTGKQIDKFLTILRLCLAWNDEHCYKKHMVQTEKLIDKGGDWDRRNRFTVYTAAHNFRIRKFKEAANGLLDSIATFSATEIFNYDKLVKYTILSSILTLDRSIIREKLIDSPDIKQVIDKLTTFKSFLLSFYECGYSEFFRSLIEIMKEFVRYDVYLNHHSNYFLREIRLRAYKQFLQSYRSVKLSSMAQEFGVTQEFLDDELSSFISCNKITCKIDKVNGIVEINRAHPKNLQYQHIIKKGDILLNRIQRLSRIITY